MSLGDFLKQVRYRAKPSPIMTASKALHKFLEHANESELLHAEQDGERFYFHCDIALNLPQTRELKAEVLIPTRYGEVELVGKVDAIDGAVHDFKLSERFDAERYAHSLQWRAYLSMFGAQKFVYHVFEGRQEKGGLWCIYTYHDLTFWGYPAMAEDVRQEVEALAGFLKSVSFDKAA